MSVGVKKPQFSGAYPQAAIREGAGELTSRADEVCTLAGLSLTQSTLRLRGWDRRWLIRTGTLFCRAIYKGIEGKEWEEKKPSESQNAKVLGAMKAVKDRREEYCDPARKEDIWGKTKTRLELWEEHLKDPLVAPAKATEMFGESLLGLAFGFTVCRCQPLSSQWLSSIAAVKILQRMWEGPCWEGVSPSKTHGMCACAHHPASGTSRGSTGRMAASFHPHKEGARGEFK